MGTTTFGWNLYDSSVAHLREISRTAHLGACQTFLPIGIGIVRRRRKWDPRILWTESLVWRQKLESKAASVITSTRWPAYASKWSHVYRWKLRSASILSTHCFTSLPWDSMVDSLYIHTVLHIVFLSKQFSPFSLKRQRCVAQSGAARSRLRIVLSYDTNRVGSECEALSCISCPTYQ